MKPFNFKQKASLLKSPVILTLSLVLIISSCDKIDRLDNFQQVNLVASNSSYAGARVDPNFITGWGFDYSPFGPAFISSNGVGNCVAYGAIGEERRSPIAIPGSGETGKGQPTGIVFNGTDNFQILNFSPARFIFAGEDGVISAWNEGDVAELIINNAPDACYTGLAIAQDAGLNFLYVANFKEFKIEVYDGTFNEVSRPFTDPALPAGYSPYNIRNIDGLLYVTYAKVGVGGGAEAGAGKGYVNVFNTNGTLSKRFISGGRLNAPWGIAKANPVFWDFTLNNASSIMVGNSGDGRINAYSVSGGAYLGTIRNQAGPIQIPGLLGISFAPDSVVAERGKLFFTAGPNAGQDGLYGFINNVE